MCRPVRSHSLGIGVGTGGARGAPPPPPPQCWSYRRYFNCENVFFSHIPAIFATIFFGSSTNFSFKNFYYALHTLKTGMCTHMYTCICHRKKFGPPNIKYLLLHCWECDTLISLPSHSHTPKRSFCNIYHAHSAIA